MPREHVVVVDHLTKRYGDHTALDGISFAVEPGEVFGLLGPNGAGKTTTLEILEGFRRPDTGRAEVLGVDPAARSTSTELRERIGIVLQDASIEPFLSVRQALKRNAGYYRSPRDVDDVLRLVGLADKADDRVKSLSAGRSGAWTSRSASSAPRSCCFSTSRRPASILWRVVISGHSSAPSPTAARRCS